MSSEKIKKEKKEEINKKIKELKQKDKLAIVFLDKQGNKTKIEGTFITSYNNVLVLKLDNGYNVGISIKKIKSIKIIILKLLFISLYLQFIKRSLKNFLIKKD